MPRTPGAHFAALPSLAGRPSTASLRRLALHAPGARATPGVPPAATTRERTDDRQRPGHPRGHRRAASRVPPCPDHAGRAGHHDLLQRGARRCGGRQQRQAPQGPLLPRQLRHPRRRVRRRLPPLPDRPRDRRHPGLAGRHRRDRQPRPRARQLLRLPQPRLPGGRRCSTPTPSGRRGRRRRRGPRLRRPGGDRPRARRRDRRHRHARRRRPGRRRPDGRGRHHQHPQLRTDRARGARRRRRPQGRPLDRAADPRLPRAAQGAAAATGTEERA